MAERCRDETGNLVANVAILIRWHMVGYRCLACGNDAIVTRRAIIDYACVIKPGAGKGGGVMANRAVFSRWQMVAVFDSSYGSRTVVT